VVGTPWQWR